LLEWFIHYRRQIERKIKIVGTAIMLMFYVRKK